MTALIISLCVLIDALETYTEDESADSPTVAAHLLCIWLKLSDSRFIHRTTTLLAMHEPSVSSCTDTCWLPCEAYMTGWLGAANTGWHKPTGLSDC